MAMRKLNAVVRPSRLSSDKVKRQVPMFDKLLVIGLEHFFLREKDNPRPEFQNDLAYLKEGYAPCADHG
jgi:hypothetical protein